MYSIVKGVPEGLLFMMVSSANHIDGLVGLTPTVTIRKPGGVFAAPVGAVIEVGNGWYEVAADYTDQDTYGQLVLHAEAPGADPCDAEYDIISAPVTPTPIVTGDILTAEEISAIARGPKKTRTEEGVVEERSIQELLLAQQAAVVAPDAVPWGIRLARARYGSTTG